jgi:hypothetical protein
MPDANTIKQVQAGNYTDAVQLLNFGVCVSSCPNATAPVNCSPTWHMVNNSNSYKDCQYYPAGKSNPAFRYNSEPLVGHFCLPSSNYTNITSMKEVFKNAFFNNVMSNKLSLYFYDIYKCWLVILVASICSVVIAYLYLFAIRFMGGMIIWVSFFVTLAALISAGFYSFFYARKQYAESDPTYNYLAYVAYVSWGLAGLVALSILFCYNAI